MDGTDGTRRERTPEELEAPCERLAGAFETNHVEATLATMVEDASVLHVPVGTGGKGKDELRAFDRDDFIPSWPDDVVIEPVRVVGASQLVDELRLTFTHSRPMNGLLPGEPPRTIASRWTW